MNWGKHYFLTNVSLYKSVQNIYQWRGEGTTFADLSSFGAPLNKGAQSQFQFPTCVQYQTELADMQLEQSEHLVLGERKFVFFISIWCDI